MIGIIKEKRSISDVLKMTPSTWKGFFDDNYDIVCKIESDLKNEDILPSPSLTFRVFYEVPLDHVKVIIIGQDPYHELGMADGLAFSCQKDINPSLKNIYRNLQMNIHEWSRPNHGNLSKWASQGVFLYNMALSVEKGKPRSHIGIWRFFTENLLLHLRKHKKNIIYILWGADARKLIKHMDIKNNLILESNHPSPQVRNSDFMQHDHFNEANIYLKSKNKSMIDWKLD